MEAKMHGYNTLRTTTGYPYADGGHPVEFDREDVEALGKLTAWGDAGTRFVLRVRGHDEIISIRACDQAKDDEKWLRKIAKGIRAGRPDRGVGWTIQWKEMR